MPFKRLNITSQLVSTNTRVSTSNVTGALLLSGGAGIRGNVYADNIVLSGNTSTINDGGANNFTIGYKAIPPSSTSSGNLALTDAGKHVYVSAGVTVPPNSTAAFDIGTVITIVNSSASSITVTQGSGVTLRLSGSSSTGNRTLAAYGLCSCIKVATDTWYISGSGMT